MITFGNTNLSGQPTIRQESFASDPIPPRREGTLEYIDEERYSVDQLERWNLGKIASTSSVQTKTRGQS